MMDLGLPPKGEETLRPRHLHLLGGHFRVTVKGLGFRVEKRGKLLLNCEYYYIIYTTIYWDMLGLYSLSPRYVSDDGWQPRLQTLNPKL